MKKLQKLKLGVLSNMLTREQMKKVVGGDYGPCTGYGSKPPPTGLPCCSGLIVGCNPLYGCGVCT